MATVRDVLKRKGSGVFTTRGDLTVHEAARIMTEHGIGSVLVVEDGQLLGLFSERDVLRRVVASALDPANTRLDQVMTKAPLITATPDTTLEECRTTMSTRRIRHMPVLAPDGSIAGIITSGDLLAEQLGDQADTIQQLTNFVYHNR